MTLPQLHLADWRPAKDTPHLYSQIVGKIRLAAGREGGRLIGCRTSDLACSILAGAWMTGYPGWSDPALGAG